MKIELTQEESLILFDYIFNITEGKKVVIDKATDLILNYVLCNLEKELSEPFRRDYGQILDSYKQTIVKRYEET